MSQPVRMILIGAGQRGARDYAPYALDHPHKLRFVAVAEPNPERRAAFAAQHSIPAENTFAHWSELLERPQMGEAALVATQDNMHVEPAVGALRSGYDVLLEKPMATTAEGCRELVATAAEAGRQLHVCHVLRYTHHFTRFHDIMQSGELGEVVTVDHRENVSFWHMAHSYVRGNWARRDGGSPMILAKCCHDFDILLWLLGRDCERLASFGNLMHFRPDKAPAGAPDFCLDGCPVAAACPYYAPFIYVDLLPVWRTYRDSGGPLISAAARVQLRAPQLVKALSGPIPPLRIAGDYRGWPRSVVTENPTRENLMAALRRGPYGRCVYHAGNDVVDHQVVMMGFAGGASVTLTMQGHSQEDTRTTRVDGSRAELNSFFRRAGSWIEVAYHRSGRRVRYDTTSGSLAEHGGGDQALMAAFVQAVRGNSPERARTTAQEALASHLLAFAAEEARLSGRVIATAPDAQ